MEKFQKFTRALAVAATAALVLSCADQAVVRSPEQEAISADVIAEFKDLGFDVSDIKMVPDDNPFTSEQGEMKYLLENDILISSEQLAEMSASKVHHVGAVGEQYRTTNLVSSPRTIRVLGFNGAGTNGLDSRMRTALQQAVDNYNNLGITLTFTLTFGSSQTAINNADMVVYRVNGPGGGSAGFPSGGRPFKFIQIQSGTSSFSTDVVEHVITHEMGHCVGFRHTDYFNRSLSCGSGGNEGSAGVGAINIPGTPTGFDANSIMLSCFSSSEDGEFGSFDVTALNFLY